MVNKVLLIGNLVADPDVKALPTGMYVARMRLATNTYAGKDDEGKAKERTEFHYLVAFGKTAEFAGQYLKKGRTVYVDGRLQRSARQPDPLGSSASGRRLGTTGSGSLARQSATSGGRSPGGRDAETW